MVRCIYWCPYPQIRVRGEIQYSQRSWRVRSFVCVSLRWAGWSSIKSLMTRWSFGFVRRIPRWDSQSWNSSFFAWHSFAMSLSEHTYCQKGQTISSSLYFLAFSMKVRSKFFVTLMKQGWSLLSHETHISIPTITSKAPQYCWKIKKTKNIDFRIQILSYEGHQPPPYTATLYRVRLEVGVWERPLNPFATPLHYPIIRILWFWHGQGFGVEGRGWKQPGLRVVHVVANHKWVWPAVRWRIDSQVAKI